MHLAYPLANGHTTYTPSNISRHEQNTAGEAQYQCW